MRRRIRRHRRNPSLKARVPAMDMEIVPRRGRQGVIKKLLRAHGFRKSGKKWKLHTPPMDVSMKAGRANPNIYSQDLRPGDVISLDGIGREHVIEGPFRSGMGIKFRDQYGNTIKLKPNEVVERVGRANPSRKRRRSTAIVRRKAPKRVMRSFRACVRKARGGSKNPWALCRRKVQRKTGRKYKALRNPRRGKKRTGFKDGRRKAPVRKTVPRRLAPGIPGMVDMVGSAYGAPVQRRQPDLYEQMRDAGMTYKNPRRRSKRRSSRR